jgi:hypothetical protein
VDYPHLGAQIGDQITFTLTGGGLTITGEVVDLDAAPDGGVRAIAVRDDPARSDPVWVRGDLIGLWRHGAPAVRAVQQLQVPALQGLNGLRQQ